VTYQDDSPQSGVVGVRKAVDERVARITALGIIINTCKVILSVSAVRKKADESELTSSFNELRVILRGQQRLRQVPEELLDKACHAVDVVVEVLRAGEVNLGGV
jgi:hypothetical protein